MSVEIVTLPCLSDNYAYLIKGTGDAVLVDAPEAGPIAATLEARGWRLGTILITHHHHDHVGAVEALRPGAEVVGARVDSARLPPLDRAVEAGPLTAQGLEFEVIDVPGHTLGHIAYYLPMPGALFSADSLMALGCGRLFEGTAEQMWASLSALAALPAGTAVYSGHEYTASNARFALSIDPGNASLQTRAEAIRTAREAGQPTVPAMLADELATNPFLRAGAPEMKAAMGLADAPDWEVFAEIRRRKDRF